MPLGTTMWNWTISHFECDHNEHCPKKHEGRVRSVLSRVVHQIPQLSGLSELPQVRSGLTNHLTNLSSNSAIAPSIANLRKLATELRYGDKTEFFESFTLLAMLVEHLQSTDREGVYVLKTKEPPLTVPNVPEGARCLDYLFIAPSFSTRFCKAFTCVAASMDAAHRTFCTGGVEILISARTGLGKNMLLCIGFFRVESMENWDIFRQLVARSGIVLSVVCGDRHVGITNVFNDWQVLNLEEHRRREQPAASATQDRTVGVPADLGTTVRVTRNSRELLPWKTRFDLYRRTTYHIAMAMLDLYRRRTYPIASNYCQYQQPKPEFAVLADAAASFILIHLRNARLSTSWLI